MKIVRSVKFGNSYELCGGTHVKNTSELKTFSIISEGSQAFGIRESCLFDKILIILKKLKEENTRKVANQKADKELKKEIEHQNKIKAQESKKQILKKINNLGEINFFADEVDLDPKSIKELCFSLSDQIDNLFLVLLSVNNDKVFISFISKSLLKTKELMRQTL